MALEHNVKRHELINVHQVIGDKDVINYLKNADHDVVEGLFYNAKRHGAARFDFGGQQYDIIHNKDFTFSIQLSETQDITPESMA